MRCYSPAENDIVYHFLPYLAIEIVKDFPAQATRSLSSETSCAFAGSTISGSNVERGTRPHASPYLSTLPTLDAHNRLGNRPNSPGSRSRLRRERPLSGRRSLFRHAPRSSDFTVAIARPQDLSREREPDSSR